MAHGRTRHNRSFKPIVIDLRNEDQQEEEIDILDEDDDEEEEEEEELYKTKKKKKKVENLKLSAEVLKLKSFLESIPIYKNTFVQVKEEMERSKRYIESLNCDNNDLTIDYYKGYEELKMDLITREMKIDELTDLIKNDLLVYLDQSLLLE
jgi:hypothetical protein